MPAPTRSPGISPRPAGHQHTTRVIRGFSGAFHIVDCRNCPWTDTAASLPAAEAAAAAHEAIETGWVPIAVGQVSFFDEGTQLDLSRDLVNADEELLS